MSVDEGGHSDVGDFTLKQLQVEAKLRVSVPSESRAHLSLLATSNTYGYIVYGTENGGFGYAFTKDVRDVICEADKNSTVTFTRGKTVETDSPVTHVRISADELSVLVALTNGKVLLFDCSELAEKEDPAFDIVYSSDEGLVDMQPNPEFSPNSFAVINLNGDAIFANFDKTSQVYNHNATCITSLLWLEDKVFAAAYLVEDSNVYVYIVTQSGTPPKSITAEEGTSKPSAEVLPSIVSSSPAIPVKNLPLTSSQEKPEKPSVSPTPSTKIPTSTPLFSGLTPASTFGASSSQTPPATNPFSGFATTPPAPPGTTPSAFSLTAKPPSMASTEKADKDKAPTLFSSASFMNKQSIFPSSATPTSAGAALPAMNFADFKLPTATIPKFAQSPPPPAVAAQTPFFPVKESKEEEAKRIELELKREEEADFAHSSEIVKVFVGIWMGLSDDLAQLKGFLRTLSDSTFQITSDSVVLKKSTTKIVSGQLRKLANDEKMSSAAFSELIMCLDECVETMNNVNLKRQSCYQFIENLKEKTSQTPDLGLGPELEGLRFELKRKLKRLEDGISQVSAMFNKCKLNIAEINNKTVSRKGEWESICRNIREITKQTLLTSEHLEALANEVDGLRLTSDSMRSKKAKGVSRSRFEVPNSETDDDLLRPKAYVELTEPAQRSLRLKIGFAKKLQSMPISTNSIGSAVFAVRNANDTASSPSAFSGLQTASNASKIAVLGSNTDQQPAARTAFMTFASKPAVPGPDPPVASFASPQAVSKSAFTAATAKATAQAPSAPKPAAAAFSAPLSNPLTTSTALKPAAVTPEHLPAPASPAVVKPALSSFSMGASIFPSMSKPQTSVFNKLDAQASPKGSLPEDSDKSASNAKGLAGFSLGSLSLKSTPTEDIDSAASHSTGQDADGPAKTTKSTGFSFLKAGTNSAFSSTSSGSNGTASGLTSPAVDTPSKKVAFGLSSANPDSPLTMEGFGSLAISAASSSVKPTTPEVGIKSSEKLESRSPSPVKPDEPTGQSQKEAISVPSSQAADRSPTAGFTFASAFGNNPPPKPFFSAFGSASTPAPVFGKPSSPADAPAVSAFGAFSSSAFSATASKTPTSTAVSAFGSASSPAFRASPGNSAFGQPVSSEKVATPSFGSTTSPAHTLNFGQASTPVSAFGTQPPAAPVFGQASKPISGFGASPSPAFGETSKPVSAFGTSPAPAFGQASTPVSAFGTSPASAFGQTSKPVSAFATAPAAPAFGQTSQPVSAFGSTPTSSFGATAAPAFGQPHTPLNAFSSPAATSAFGQTSAFSSQTTSPFAAPSTSAFGQPNSSAFGGQTSAFGGGGNQTGAAFGQTSALGMPGSGAFPAFGAGFGGALPGPRFPDASSLRNAPPVFNANSGTSFAALASSANSTDSTK
ncbi:hypothetical protein HDU67_003614 [Dinochytrium kinnereticum]|nr:hypothetical protein HDU67_003614 [Dinochytrium kinnereticum]